MSLSGTDRFKIKIILRNPLDHSDVVDYNIIANESRLSVDWATALEQIVINGNQLEKNFCFLGFPHSARTFEYLVTELNSAITTINNYFSNYQIEETYSVETLRHELDPNHELLNLLHNHFERLQGTVESLSNYYRQADYNTKYAIRQLNIICHEIESLLLSQRKLVKDPQWVRPSQITTFLNAQRYTLSDEHRQGFLTNGYDREFGGVYMHWTQIGKTLFEVWRDENAPALTTTVCEAITHLQYYSGEFDIDWAQDCKLNTGLTWHDNDIKAFTRWLIDNGRDPVDVNLSLGYLPLGKVSTQESFGTNNPQEVWKILGSHLDIFKIEINDKSVEYNYCWNDLDYKQKQIDMLRPGYDFSSRGR